jgi:predicted CopG family antitoxin
MPEKLKYVLTHNTLVVFMVNITLTVPEEMYKEMKKHRELKWSDIARQAFRRKLKEIKLVDELLSKSELTEDDAEIIGHKIKHEIRKRLWK